MYPISRSSLLFLPFLSWYFIDEKINLTGAIGIGMIAVGTLLMPLRSFDRSGWREIGKKSSFLYAILAALTVALYSLWDKIAIQHVNPFLYLYSYTVVVTILYSVYGVYRFSKASIIMEWKANRWPIVQVGFFNVFTYMLVLIAMLYARVTYIGGIRQLSVVVGVILAQRYLSEKISRPALCGLIISLFGSVVIYFSK